MANIATCASCVIAVVTVIYAKLKYDQHRKEKKEDVLAHYNERYSKDPHIQKVIVYYQKLYDNNDASEDIPTVNDVELFLRFFEELYAIIKTYKLDKKRVAKVFGFYAVAFYVSASLQCLISDYNEKNLWTDFKEFARDMKKIFAKEHIKVKAV